MKKSNPLLKFTSYEQIIPIPLGIGNLWCEKRGGIGLPDITESGRAMNSRDIEEVFCPRFVRIECKSNFYYIILQELQGLA